MVTLALPSQFLIGLLLNEKHKKGMQIAANTEEIFLSLPDSDMSFLKSLSKKMGWTIKRKKKTGIEKALDDIKAGRVYEAKDADDLFSQLEK